MSGKMHKNREKAGRAENEAFVKLVEFAEGKRPRLKYEDVFALVSHFCAAYSIS